MHSNATRLLTDWLLEHPPTGPLFLDDGAVLDRHLVGRIGKRVAASAGLGHVHPHQVRHTFATHAITVGCDSKRSRRCSAIAAPVTLTYSVRALTEGQSIPTCHGSITSIRK